MSVALVGVDKGDELLENILEAADATDYVYASYAQCKYTLAFGEEALRSILPDFDGTFASLRGTYIQLNNGDYIIPTWHPRYIMQQPQFFIDFVNDIQKAVDGYKKPINPTYTVIETQEMLEFVIFAMMRDMVLIAVDIETTGLDFNEDFVRAFGFAADKERAWIIPERLMHNANCLELLQDFLTSKVVITHNGISFDDPFINNAWEINMKTTLDTMLMHYAIDERKGTHGLDDLAKTYYGMGNYKTEVRSTGYRSAGEKALFKMLATDVCLTYALCQKLDRQLESENLWKLVKDRIQPAGRALSIMEQNGVLIDVPYLQSVGNLWAREAFELTKQLREELDAPDFNPRSPKQVAELMYDDFGWKTPRGMKLRGTDVKVMAKLLENKDPDSTEYKQVNTIIEIRQKLHLRSTYVEGIIKRIDKDGRIRTNFKVHGTETGRLSSSDPNLQNIPQIIGPVLREAFVASEGYTLIEGDYSQLELRTGCYYSHDPAYIEAFQKGIDIHASVAAQIYGIPVEEVSHNQRHFAKFFNFGLPYGRGDKSVADQMGVSLAEAQAFHQAWNKKYARHFAWMQSIKKQVMQEGELTSAFGRKRRFPFVNDRNSADIEREALNFPVSSLAADICLGSLVKLTYDMSNARVPASIRSLLTVHDSIMLECPDEIVDDTCRWMKRVMEDVPLKAPYDFPVEIKIGKRWGSLEKWKGE